jgi:hypothetical protein
MADRIQVPGGAELRQQYDCVVLGESCLARREAVHVVKRRRHQNTLPRRQGCCAVASLIPRGDFVRQLDTLSTPVGPDACKHRRLTRSRTHGDDSSGGK